MGAIRAHKTATDTESSWDGPAEVAKAPNDAKTLKYMHAWVNDDGDPEAKSSYKFPHHAAGTDTPANINGVNNALARLSQSDIPEADRVGVKAHLDAHRKDAGLDVNAEAAIPRSHEPIRCFDGTAKPHEPFWRFKNVADGEEPEMELYGYISEYSWFEDDITPKIFKDDLNRYGKGGPITIRMNSYGGDVIAASLINTIIKEYPGMVTVQIDGIAASAATVVAVAGDKIRMQETAYFMIHDPLAVFFLAMLNIEELSRMVDSLKAVKEGIVNAYESKTGLSRTRISNLMTEETWMDAQKAVDLGFADEVIKGGKEPIAIPIENAAMVNALRNYVNVPAAILAPASAPVEPVKNMVAKRLRAEAKILKKENK